MYIYINKSNCVRINTLMCFSSFSFFFFSNQFLFIASSCASVNNADIYVYTVTNVLRKIRMKRNTKKKKLKNRKKMRL